MDTGRTLITLGVKPLFVLKGMVSIQVKDGWWNNGIVSRETKYGYLYTAVQALRRRLLWASSIV